MESTDNLVVRMPARLDLVSSEQRGTLVVEAVQDVFRPQHLHPIVMDFLHTLTPNEALLLLLAGALVLLACLGLAIWLVIR